MVADLQKEEECKDKIWQDIQDQLRKLRRLGADLALKGERRLAGKMLLIKAICSRTAWSKKR